MITLTLNGFLAAAAASGEVYDLYMGGSDAASLTSRGLFQPIRASLIEEYAPDFVSLMEPFIRPLWTSRGPKQDPVEHTVSLFPLYKAAGEALFMDFRADLCQAAGYTRGDVETMTDWNQVYFLLKDARDAAGEGFVGLASTSRINRYGSGLIGPDVICGGSAFADTIVYDNLGDSANLLATIGGNTVICIWDINYGGSSINPESAAAYLRPRYEVQDRMNAWYLSGLIWPDSGTDAYPGDPDEVFARIYRASVLTPEDPDRFRVKIADALYSSAESLTGYFAIPASCPNPSAALRVLNAIYAPDTGRAWAELMVYGVRDVDWVVGPDGRLTFPEGQTAETVSYRNAELGCCPLFLGEWDTEETGTRLLQTRALADMRRSDYYGFTVSTADYGELVRTLRSLAGSNIPYLTWGRTYGQITHQAGGYASGSAAGESVRFSQDLEEAGLGEYMKLFQARLDAWLKE